MMVQRGRRWLGVHRPEDPAAIAQAIVAAASVPAVTKEKGHRAVLVASRYSRQVSLCAYRDLAEKLLAR